MRKTTPKKKPKPAVAARRTRQALAKATPAAQAPSAPAALLKLDLGCGPNKQLGFFGVDQYAMPNVDLVWDLGDRSKPWPWPDNSVGEVHCSHFLEHLPGGDERVWFMNELCRVLAPGASARIIVPAWSSGRAYGDFTHQWPPVSEMYFYYLSKEWRAQNAPHTDIQWNPLGYSCSFDFGCTYGLHAEFVQRAQSVQQFAVNFYKEAAQDLIAILTKPIPAV